MGLSAVSHAVCEKLGDLISIGHENDWGVSVGDGSGNLMGRQ